MKINLYNRNGIDIWLEQIGNWWQLRTNQIHILDYTRLIFEENEEKIYAVDPPGGPFLMVGSEVGIYIVGEIRNTSLGIFLRLKENKKE